MQPVRDAAADERLQSALEQATREYPGIVTSASAHVCDLQSMRCGQWRAETDIYPASVIKVPIMAEVFHRFVQGTLRPDDRVVVTHSNQTATSGPAPFVPGYEATVEELVSFMIAHSDNVATNQLIDILRRERITDYMRSLGLSTFLLGRKLSGSEPLIEDPEQTGRNRLTAMEIGTLLTLIARDAIPGSARQYEILRACVDNAKLAAGLRENDLFAHKTGETEKVSHDAGILVTSSGDRYVIVLYCEVVPRPDGADATHANPFMARWMRSVREWL